MAIIELFILEVKRRRYFIMLLNTECWINLLRILKDFGYELNGSTNNLENQKFLWEIIINIKENMQDELEQSIRVNMQLCYLLEESEQIKDINAPLFRLNHILEQDFYRFDNDPYKGLKNFHKLIISSYGNINNFLSELKIVKENLSFVRKRIDQELIEKYNYLKEISLPLRGYEKMRMALLTILKKFTELHIIVSNPQAQEKLREEINEFINCYKVQYTKEHEYYHQKLSDFYGNLYSLPEYNALDNLSSIRIIKVAYNMKPIKKYIETFFPDQCEVINLNEILEKKVKCNCGFNLGERITIPSLKKIKPMLRKGIKEYLSQLQNKRFKGLFENYLTYNNNSFLIELLEINPANLNGSINKINKELIKEINEALSSTYPLKVSLEEIASYLDASYPVNQLDLLREDLEKGLKIIIKNKMGGMENIIMDDIIINLIK